VLTTKYFFTIIIIMNLSMTQTLPTSPFVMMQIADLEAPMGLIVVGQTSVRVRIALSYVYAWF
jgi:hypothetical protein